MRQRILCAVIVAAGLMGLPYAWSDELDSDTCQILDKPLEHLYEIGVSYVPDSRFEGYGKSDVLELDADWAFGYIKDFGGGEMDFSLFVQDIMFLDSADLNLPSQVGKVVLDSGFTLRNPSGTAVQIRLLPGLYADLDRIDTDSFYVPVSFALIRAFRPDLSGRAGLDIRPGFRRLFMPIVGLAWKISDGVRLDAGLPQTKLQWAIAENLETYLALEWENTSFDLGRADHTGDDRLTIDDISAYWGMQYRVSDSLQFKGEIGNVFNRSVEFDQDPDSKIDVQSALFVRFAVGAPF